MNLPKHILVIRLSAPGDVAMTIPVLHSFQKRYPSVKLTILTSRRLLPLFKGLNASLYFAETKSEHKGFAGLFKLFKQLNRLDNTTPIDAVADLHNVLRSQVVRGLYKIKGVKTAAIDKGRAGKKELTRKKDKILKQLPSTFDRYKTVFEELGFNFEFDFKIILPGNNALPEKIKSIIDRKEKRWIGIAPFAAYNEKMYPLDLMEKVVEELYADSSLQMIFFGSKEDGEVLVKWQEKFPGIVIAAGKFSIEEELELMSQLNVMISMDSANMHFASLVNVPVVSVWGATHPFAGFMGWGQSIDNAAQIDLYCRPCSVFGNKPCYRGDHACMKNLSPAIIIGKVKDLVSN
ncbi:MAG: glycosyltransferase family 9 protein [Chitinophagaceae bacterium]